MSNLASYLVAGKGPDSISGMNPNFQTSLAAMFAAAPPDIQKQLQIASGFRSNERQAQLYQQALNKYGSPEAARRWVAPPGRSQHNHGNAADLRYASPAALQWAHKNAGAYGLSFPLGNENWHIELAGARGGAPHDHKADEVVLAQSSAAPVPTGQSFAPATTATPAVADVAPMSELGAPLAAMFAALPMNMNNTAATQERAAAEKARKQAIFGDGGIADAFG